MRIPRYFALGLAGLGLVWCLGVSSASAQGHASGAATDPLGNINRLPADLESRVGQFRAGLEADGFAVARGYWTLWSVDDCKYPIQTLGYCYGNNPTAPYVAAVVPPWPDEYVDQRFHHILNEPQRNMVTDYRLAPREALVVVAQLPPQARYFGLGSNVFTRKAALNKSDRIYLEVTDLLLRDILFGASPDPSRMMLVSSIGKSINDAMMENQMGTPPWNKQAYFVITSDADMATEMTERLKTLGADEGEIFIEPVSPDLVNIGLDYTADDLITYIRYSLPKDTAAGEQWRHDLPLTVLRVRDTKSKVNKDSFAIPTYGVRTANLDENQLATDLEALQNAVLANWNQQQTPQPFFSAYKYLDLIGQHCLGYPDPTRGPMDCLGDTQDADYQISESAQLDDGQVVAVMGTLSTATNNATYTSLSVNWFPELVGEVNIDDPALLGTADGFKGVLQHDSKYFYLYYVARDCTGLSNCVEVSKKMVPTGGLIKLIQRNYINPGSTSGPDPDKILNPVMIVFDGKNRP